MAATQREEKIKREERCEEVRGRSQFQWLQKAVAFFTFSCSMSASTVWKTTLETEKVKLHVINCLPKILYIFNIICRCTIKFGLVNYSEKITIPGTVRHAS